MRKQPFTAEEFQALYSRVPRLTVEVVIQTDSGFLLKKREEKSWAGMWHIPGGTVLYKESVAQALQRIAKEELDLEIAVGSLLGYIEYPSEEKERGFGWSVGLAFACTPMSTEKLNAITGENIQFFPKIPDNCVVEQATFLNALN